MRGRRKRTIFRDDFSILPHFQRPIARLLKRGAQQDSSAKAAARDVGDELATAR
jgi:hypothetical protein